MGLADWTGLEPATSGVTGRHSNQLNYQSTVSKNNSQKWDCKITLIFLLNKNFKNNF